VRSRDSRLVDGDLHGAMKAGTTTTRATSSPTTRRSAAMKRNLLARATESEESDAVADAREVDAHGLPRSDSAMTLRGVSAKTSATRGEAETTVMPETMPETTTTTTTCAPERRWYRMVKMHDHGVCTTAVADAELALLEASILRSAAPSGCERMVGASGGGGGGVAWNVNRPCSSGEDGERGRWAPDDAEYEVYAASGFAGEARDDSASAWERGGDASASAVNASVNAPTNVVASNGHMKPGGPCDHCGAVDSPQWRRGPASKPMLCNACGTRYRRTNSLGPAPSSRMATPEKRKNVSQNDARGKKSARCAVGGDNGKFSRAHAVVY